MNRQQQQRVTRQCCRYCGKSVSSDQYVTHQTQCLIKIRQRRHQQQQQQPHQQNRFTQQQQQQRQPQIRQTYQQNIYYDDSDESVDSDQNQIQMPDFNQIFGPGSVFQRSMDNMRNQMSQAFNINLNFDNNQLQFNIQSNGGGRQQVFVSNLGPGIHIQQTFNYPQYDYSDDEEEEEYEEEQQSCPMNSHQIKQIPTQKYKPNPSNQQCVVCMIDFKKLDNVKVLDCLHTFHAKCIDQWLKQKGECPVCRHRLI